MDGTVHRGETLGGQAQVGSAVRRAQRGDGDALRFLYLRYAATVRRCAAALLQDADAAEDVVQITFLKVLTRLGSYEPLHSDNPRVFAHIRQWEDDTILCVHNLARSAQPVQFDLSRYAGMVPEEMFGRTSFPPIGDLPYLLTLAPRGFFWFELKVPAE